MGWKTRRLLEKTKDSKSLNSKETAPRRIYRPARKQGSARRECPRITVPCTPLTLCARGSLILFPSLTNVHDAGGGPRIVAQYTSVIDSSRAAAFAARAVFTAAPSARATFLQAADVVGLHAR